MKRYRVTFTYGTWKLWADIERYKIPEGDRMAFADIAQLAVSIALDSIPQRERTHVAHDYLIFEISQDDVLDAKTANIVYAFDSLMNE